MFTLNQIREYCQEIDSYVNDLKNKKKSGCEETSNKALTRLLIRLEKEFGEIFEPDTKSKASNTYYVFKKGDERYSIIFRPIEANIRMLCVNPFKEEINRMSGLPDITWKDFIPIHEFIFKECNPEGVLMLQRLMFEEII
jgi:hypothetical protein